MFPLQRLKELEAEGVIGRVAERHYGFGLCPDAEPLIKSGREVARLLKQDGVDLALLVPALPLCTRSVGLLAREVEGAGITTAALALVREVAVEVRAPRMLYLHWPYGHAMGEPGNVEQQRAILHDLLSMARTAPRPGLLVDLPYRWRRETYPPIDDWNADSAAFTTALAAAIDASPAPQMCAKTETERAGIQRMGTRARCHLAKLTANRVLKRFLSTGAPGAPDATPRSGVRPPQWRGQSRRAPGNR
jgi:hypothetical protein